MTSIKNFFSAEEKKKIVEAIQRAELNTSGEIRLHVESSAHGNALDSAAYWFKKLSMNKTEARNGVLFYLALHDRQFAIIGDVGINEKVAENFWDTTKESMQNNFKKGLITEGLVHGIELAGNQLKEFFPYQKDDVNELPDDISFGK